MKTKKFAAMSAALLISASTMGYLPQGSIKISNVIANAAEEEKITSVEINEANFPDENFREYVKENFDTDGDVVLSVKELDNVHTININNKNIADLTGLEHFTALTGLYCENNQLTSLDLSKNTLLVGLKCSKNKLTSLNLNGCTQLNKLYCDNNQLTTLDIKSNILLTALHCSNNQLTNLGVSNNKKLTSLYCNNNMLSILDVSNNNALMYLSCSGNQLSAIDVSQNNALDQLYCSGNQITSLDVSNNIALTNFNCNGNQLKALDVSKNTALKFLYCSKNQLADLNVNNNKELIDLQCSNNQLTTLNTKQNTKLKDLRCNENQLTSLDLSNNLSLKSYPSHYQNNKYIINLTDNTFDLSTLPAGFDVKKASEWTNATVEENILTIKDVAKEVTYKYDCGYDTYATFTLIPASSADTSNSVAIDATNFPDENFRKFVKNYYDKDDDGVLSTEEIAAVTEMTLIDYISHSKIEVSDLKGIEYFTNLELLDCHTQNLKELDLSRNTSLKALDCRENQLTTLDLSNNTALTSLKCDNNQLTELDLSNNTELLALFCNENQLTILNVSKNTMLYRLECSKNQLTTIDTSNNTNLQTLMCDENQLTTIDISNNTLLDYLSCNQNQLKTIDISKNEELDFLKCNQNQLTSIDTHGRSLSLEIFDNKYEIALTNNSFDLSTLPGGFDAAKASEWTNVTVEGNILTVIDDTKYVTYDYDCGKGITLSFTLFTQNCTEKPNTEKTDVKIDKTNFPDKAFRQYITEKIDDDKDGTLSYSEAMAVSTMFISELGISDLTGLQYFKNLQTLGCSDNDLTQLDISENKALTHLYCDNNNLTTLDTSNNPFLYALFCHHNNLTNLDVRNNTELSVLWCSYNQLTTLDVSKNTALKDLGCDNNQLTSLDLSNNKILNGDEIIFATDNNKYKINLTNNTFDLSTLPAGFDITKASEWTNGTVKDNILTVNDISKEVTYKYDCGHETIEIFTLIPTNESVTPPTQEIKVTLKGDANCDGKVTIADATAILQSLGNPDKYNLSAQGEKNADVTGNDGVMPSDAVMIQAYDAKMIDEF